MTAPLAEESGSVRFNFQQHLGGRESGPSTKTNHSGQSQNFMGEKSPNVKRASDDFGAFGRMQTSAPS